MKRIRLGTRGSALAMVQALAVRARLSELHPDVDVEVVQVRTQGDVIQSLPLSRVQGQGFFVKELESALLQGEIDLAVHSAKDLPSQLAPGLTVRAVPPREDPRDCLVSREGVCLADLPPGASIGTSALRRQALIAAERPDLVRRELRGNIDTRLRKLAEGQFAAMVVALAALRRLGQEERVAEVFEIERFVPAVAQGALAIEVRESDPVVRDIVGALDHDRTHREVRAERALLAAAQGGCQLPLGAHCRTEESESGAVLVLHACLVSVDGRHRVDATDRGPTDAPEELGRRTAGQLLAGGGRDILAAIRGG